MLKESVVGSVEERPVGMVDVEDAEMLRMYIGVDVVGA